MVNATPPLSEPAIPDTRVRRWRSGLRARLFGLGAIVALPLIALSAYRLWQHREMGDQMVRGSVLQATNLVGERIEQRVANANAMLDVLTASVDFEPDARTRNDSLLTRTLHSAGGVYGNIYAYRADGALQGTARYRPALDSLRPMVRAVAERLRSTGTLHIGVRGRSITLTDSAYVILFARGVFRGDDIVGLVGITVRVDSLAQVVDIPSILPGTVVTLFDTTGTILARSRDGRTIVPDSSRAHNPRDLAVADGVRTFRLTPTSEMRVLGHKRIARAPWYVDVSVPAAAAFAPVQSELVRDLIVALFAVASALGLAYIVGGRIVRPINVLTTDARTIARGVTEHRSRITDRSEIGVLASAFNHMADTVARRSAALADSERRYRLLFDSNPLPMWAWDADTLEILAVNEAAQDHYGYDRDTFLSLKFTDIIDAVDAERFSRLRLPFSETRQSAGTWTHRTSDGRRVEMDVVTTSSRRLGRASWLSVGIDITARREAERALARSEEQLRQAQKMEAIGAFAGGIAHDFNNLLTGMLGYCDLALIDLDRDTPLARDVDEIRKLALRGADLTRQILAVSRKQVVQPTVLDPNTVVRGLDRLLARLIGEHIVIETHLDEHAGRIKADVGQLEQVLLNLAANARDAMPGGGTLSIVTRRLSSEESVANGLAPEHHWTAVTLRDTGVGMAPDVRQRIFEPFFTTKERGKGTGLGLALAYSMVDQAGGTILVDTAPGKGSTFTLCFPAVADAVSMHTSGEHVARELKGTETILLAEDEESVRNVAKTALARWGYHVITAADGASALAASRAHDGRIDLLLTDVVMPGMNGRELAECLRIERPETRVLFASGYTDDATLLTGIRVDELSFVQKPFTPLEIVRRVREALDEPLRVA